MALVDLYELPVDRSSLPAPSVVHHAATSTRKDSDEYTNFELPSSDAPRDPREEVDSGGSLFHAVSLDTPTGDNDELL